MDEAQRTTLMTEDVMHGKYLIFQVGDGDYGIEIRHVMEIISIQDITPVPHTHHYVKGIINLRGAIVPVVDIELRFGYAEKAYTDRTCIIVLRLDTMSMGLIVDEVREVVFIGDEQIRQPPYMDAAEQEFVKHMGVLGEDVKQLLDIRKIFEEEALS